MVNDRLPPLRCLHLRGLLMVMLACTSGCASVWWNSFLDPSQVGNFHDNNVVNEIQQTISFRDTPGGVAGATDPTPEDLVQTVEEYEIGVGDQLSIRVLDFLQRDVESEFTPTVDELGYISVPQIGWIYVQSLTVRELQSEIIQRSRRAGIFREDGPEPTIIVNFLQQQSRIYQIMGTVQQPGRYHIIPPDFRLREAINQAGGLVPDVKTIIVVRNSPKPKRIVDRGVRSGAPATTPQQEPPVSPPVSPMSLSEMAGGPAAPAPPPAAPTTAASQAPAQAAKPDPSIALPTEQDLMDAVSPTQPSKPASIDATTRQSSDTPTPTPASSPTTQGMKPFIFVNNRFIEAPAAQAPTATPSPDAPPISTDTQAPPPSATSKPVDWQELASEGQQRTIRIPADKLLNGDPNYNIVIKHDDYIRLDSGPTGVFYIMGQVVRPGTFSLTGQNITLRQAIATAGGLGPFAWPSRCEVVRRIDGDREETTQWDLERIMNGKDPDFYLKPEDLINVGTHPIAPLLATIRNSFRLTYGFGFVYDRNFADVDSYFAQGNPNDRRRTQLATRFPGLFP